MFKQISPKEISIRNFIGQFPHCDARCLHAPEECEYCDRYPQWQALRVAWGIAFTGYEPEASKKELPDPATHARSLDLVNRWIGNIAVPREAEPEKEQKEQSCP